MSGLAIAMKGTVGSTSVVTTKNTYESNTSDSNKEVLGSLDTGGQFTNPNDQNNNTGNVKGNGDLGNNQTVSGVINPPSYDSFEVDGLTITKSELEKRNDAVLIKESINPNVPKIVAAIEFKPLIKNKTGQNNTTTDNILYKRINREFDTTSASGIFDLQVLLRQVYTDVFCDVMSSLSDTKIIDVYKEYVINDLLASFNSTRTTYAIAKPMSSLQTFLEQYYNNTLTTDDPVEVRAGEVFTQKLSLAGIKNPSQNYLGRLDINRGDARPNDQKLEKIYNDVVLKIEQDFLERHPYFLDNTIESKISNDAVDLENIASLIEDGTIENSEDLQKVMIPYMISVIARRLRMLLVTYKVIKEDFLVLRRRVLKGRVLESLEDAVLLPGTSNRSITLSQPTLDSNRLRLTNIEVNLMNDYQISLAMSLWYKNLMIDSESKFYPSSQYISNSLTKLIFMSLGHNQLFLGKPEMKDRTSRVKIFNVGIPNGLIKRLNAQRIETFRYAAYVNFIDYMTTTSVNPNDPGLSVFIPAGESLRESIGEGKRYSSLSSFDYNAFKYEINQGILYDAFNGILPTPAPVFSNLIKIKVYKVNNFNPKLVYKPVSYLFDMTKFVFEDLNLAGTNICIGEELDGSLLKGITDTSKFSNILPQIKLSEINPYKNFSPLRINSVRMQNLSSKLAGGDNDVPDYNITDIEEANQIFMNHFYDFIMKKYMQIMLGINISEETFHFKSSGIFNKGHPHPRNSDSTSLKKIIEFFLENRSQDTENLSNNSLGVLSGINILVKEFKRSICENTTLHKTIDDIIRPKIFDRVFAIPVNEDLFEIDTQKTSLNLLSNATSIDLIKEKANLYSIGNLDNSSYYVTIELQDKNFDFFGKDEGYQCAPIFDPPPEPNIFTEDQLPDTIDSTAEAIAGMLDEWTRATELAQTIDQIIIDATAIDVAANNEKFANDLKGIVENSLFEDMINSGFALTDPNVGLPESADDFMNSLVDIRSTVGFSDFSKMGASDIMSLMSVENLVGQAYAESVSVLQEFDSSGIINKLEVTDGIMSVESLNTSIEAIGSEIASAVGPFDYAASVSDPGYAEAWVSSAISAGTNSTAAASIAAVTDSGTAATAVVATAAYSTGAVTAAQVSSATETATTTTTQVATQTLAQGVNSNVDAGLAGGVDESLTDTVDAAAVVSNAVTGLTNNNTANMVQKAFKIF